MLIKARVKLKHPNHLELKNNGNTSIDMHYHTKYSDGTKKIPVVVKKAMRLKIGVAITDHNQIKGALEIDSHKEILSIPGIETTSKEGIHTLHYFYNASELTEFYNHNILPNKINDSHFLDIPFHELFDLAKDYNCLTVAAHPYGISWTGICNPMHKEYISTKTLSKFDGIEVLNGGILKHMNKSALCLAQSLKKPITGGSDGHRLFELGKVLTYTKNQLDREGFLNAIKKHNSFVVGKESNVVEKIASNSQKITIPIKHPINYMQKGYTFTKSLIKSSF